MTDHSYTMDDEAACWVARMDAASWSAEHERELQAWLAADPRRSGALLQAQAAWMTLDPPISLAAVRQPEVALMARFNRRGLLGYGGAAIAASVAAGLYLLSGVTRYATGVGEIRRVPLADGSVAAINSASQVEIELSEVRRKVRVNRGEAWFQVTKDPQRPFIVEAGRVRVQAVGTAFAVRRHQDGAEILVTEGVVEAWAEGADGHRIRLGAGSRAFVADNARIKQEAAGPSSVDRALAWRNGKIELIGSQLDQAVAEFNRYNARQLVIVDPTLRQEELDGIFRVDDPEGFAIAVKSSLAVPIDLSKSDQILIGRPEVK